MPAPRGKPLRATPYAPCRDRRLTGLPAASVGVAEIEQHLAAVARVLLGDVESTAHVAEVDLVADDAARVDKPLLDPVDHLGEHRAVQPRRVQRELLLGQLLL